VVLFFDRSISRDKTGIRRDAKGDVENYALTFSSYSQKNLIELDTKFEKDNLTNAFIVSLRK